MDREDALSALHFLQTKVRGAIERIDHDMQQPHMVGVDYAALLHNIADDLTSALDISAGKVSLSDEGDED